MGLRVIGTLIGGGFLTYAAIAVISGTVYDVDDGRVNRATQPITFWLFVFGMTLLGLTILGVGWEWPVMDTARRGLSMLTSR